MVTTFHTALNFVSTTVASPRLAGSDTVEVTQGFLFGSVFPLWAVIFRGPDELNLVNLCILEVTGRSGNVLTVSGATDGTTDVNLEIDDIVRICPNAKYLKEIHDSINGLELDLSDVDAATTPATNSEAIYAGHEIVCYGDSIVQGTGGGPFAPVLSSLTGRVVLNRGVGGNTSTQIRTRMVADTTRHIESTIIWAGRNNFASGTTVKADIAAMVAALGHTRYLVLGILNASDEPNPSTAYTQITTLNSQLAALYGANYFDMRAYLVSQYNPGIPQDVTDYSNDVPPTSLRFDSLHPNAAGNAAIAARLAQSDLLSILTLTGTPSKLLAQSNLPAVFLSNVFLDAIDRRANLDAVNTFTTSQSIFSANTNDLCVGIASPGNPYVSLTSQSTGVTGRFFLSTAGGGFAAIGTDTNNNFAILANGSVVAVFGPDTNTTFAGNIAAANIGTAAAHATGDFQAAGSYLTSPIAESDVTGLVSDLSLKAPLVSPALTGTPTAPTATVGTDTTQIATTAFVLANAGSSILTGTTADADVPDGSIFLGSDHGDRPCWKDPDGAVHLLSYTDPAAAPALTSATVAANGTTFTVVLTNTPTGHAGFTLNSDGGQILLTYVSGDGTGTVVYSTDRTVYSVETLTLDYTPGDITTGTNLAAFTDATVTNNSTQTAPDAFPAGIVWDSNSLSAADVYYPHGEDPPAQLALLRTTPDYTVVNTSVSGQSTTMMALDQTRQIAPYLATYTGARTVLVFWELTNQLSGGTLYDEARHEIIRYFHAAHLIGIRRGVILDCIDRFSLHGNPNVALANAALASDFPVATSNPRVWLRGPGTDYANILIKLSEIFTDCTDTTLYLDDQVHLKPIAATMIAAEVDFALGVIGILPDAGSPPSDTYALGGFTAVNGTDCELIPMTWGGGWWAMEATAWDVQGNKARRVSGTGPLVADVFQADSTITIPVTLGTGYDVGITFNFHTLSNIQGDQTDAANYWLFRVTAGTAKLYRVDLGVQTEVGTASASVSVSGTYTLKVVANADQVSCSIDAADLIDYTVTGRAFKLGTFAGLWANESTSRFGTMTAAILPAPPPASITDTFTAANGTLIESRPTDSGHTWSIEPLTEWEIQSNRCVMKTSTYTFEQQAQAWIDAGQADRLVTCVQNVLNDYHSTGVIFRRSDALNFWIFYFAGFSAYLSKVVAGSYVAAQTVYFPQTGVRNITITCEGDNISATVDGAGGTTLMVTDSFNNTATQFGLRDTVTPGYGGYFDDFNCGPLV